MTRDEIMAAWEKLQSDGFRDESLIVTFALIMRTRGMNEMKAIYEPKDEPKAA